VSGNQRNQLKAIYSSMGLEIVHRQMRLMTVKSRRMTMVIPKAPARERSTLQRGDLAGHQKKPQPHSQRVPRREFLPKVFRR